MNAGSYYKLRDLPVVERRRETPKARIDLADLLYQQIRALRLPPPEREAQRVPGRKFRSDLCWREAMVVAEVDGGEWTAGRHGRGIGMQQDCIKQNALTLAGWTVLRFTGSQVKNGYAIETIEQVFGRPRSLAAHGETGSETGR